MLGAIIGDLAASTYINDHSVFYDRLISDDACLSEKGKLIFEAVNILNDNRFAERDRFHSFIPTNDRENWKFLMLCIVNNWWHDNYEYNSRSSVLYDIDTYKDVLSATFYLSKIIFYLRNGLTKDEMYQEMKELKGYRHVWYWKNDEDPFCYVIKAWDAFYNSYDFGSALHNAMRMEGDKHLLGTLTGAIAESMYGCGYYFKKRKFCRQGKSPRLIELPRDIVDRYGLLLDIIKKQKESKRVFFYKNDAMTNVERINFVPVQCDIYYHNFTEEQRRLLTKAFWPDWDNRYGIYWDNGWYYVYRSFILIARFHLKKIGGTYQIQDLQKGENNDVQNAVEEVLYSVFKNFS